MRRASAARSRSMNAQIASQSGAGPVATGADWVGRGSFHIAFAVAPLDFPFAGAVATVSVRFCGAGSASRSAFVYKRAFSAWHGEMAMNPMMAAATMDELESL